MCIRYNLKSPEDVQDDEILLRQALRMFNQDDEADEENDVLEGEEDSEDDLVPNVWDADENLEPQIIWDDGNDAGVEYFEDEAGGEGAFFGDYSWGYPPVIHRGFFHNEENDTENPHEHDETGNQVDNKKDTTDSS